MVSVVEAEYRSLLCLGIQITPTVEYLPLTATLKLLIGSHNPQMGREIETSYQRGVI